MSIWSRVQSNQAAASGQVSSLTCTFGSSVTVGDVVVVYFTTSRVPVGNLISISDSGGNTYTIDSTTQATATFATGIAHSIVTTGGTLTITATVNGGTGFLNVGIEEWSYSLIFGIDSVSNIGFSPAGTTQSTGQLSVTATDLVVGVLTVASAVTYSAGPGFTLGLTHTFGGGSEGMATIYAANVTSAVTPTWVLGTSQSGLSLSSIAYRAANLACSITTVSPNDNPSVTLSGGNTTWLTSRPVFTISGGTGAAITGVSFSNNTTATATLSSGTQPGATLTITDPSTGAMAIVTVTNTVNTWAMIPKSGGMVRLAFSNSSNQPVKLTSVTANATINVNGSPVSCLGPFWSPSGGYPWLDYQLPVNVGPSAVVTFAASAGWVVTSAGNATVYSSGSVPNYTGQIEPPLFGYESATYLPSVASPGTMPIGFNAIICDELLPANIGLNWLPRATWHNIATYDSNGHPLTTSAGTATAEIANYQQPNGQDGLSMPDLQGTYTYVASDSAASTPMLCYLSVASGAATIMSGPTSAAGPNAASGTTSGGVVTNQVWQWVITRQSGVSLTQLNIQVTLHVQTHSNTAGSWTQFNEAFFPPNGENGPASVSITNPNLSPTAPDPNFLRWINVANKPAAALRFVNNSAAWTGSVVDVSDLMNLTQWNYFNPPVTTVAVQSIQAYSLATSPNVYVSSPYVGTTQNLSVSPPNNLAYYWTPGAITWINWPLYNVGSQPSSAYGWYVMEVVTAVPHNFKSGYAVYFSGTIPTISVTNGSVSSTVSLSISYNNNNSTGWTEGAMWVTGASKFVLLGFGQGLLTNSLSGIPMNNVATTFTPSPNTLFVNVQTPTGACTPYELNCSVVEAIPGCGYYCNIPPFATDATVLTIAARILAYTSAGRKVYVEYANEIWNTGAWAPFSMYAAAKLSGVGPWAAIPWTDWYVVRASQVHAIFTAEFTAVGRQADLVLLIGSQGDNPGQSTSIVNAINGWNATSPATPAQPNAVNLAPYLGTPVDTWANPNAIATVTEAGNTGHLAAGNYYAAFTYIDLISGLETTIGTSESAQFTVNAGQIATVTFNDPPGSHSPTNPNVSTAYPAWAATRNLYLTNTNGASGSEVQYATGIAMNTNSYACTLAVNSSTLPPTNNRMPAMSWAFASAVKSDTRSIANSGVNPGNVYASNPWTYSELMDFLRFFAKYNLQWGGPNGNIPQHVAILAALSPTPYLVCYESGFQNFCVAGVQNGAGGLPNLASAIEMDLFFHPDTYWCELAYNQMLQRLGFRLNMPLQTYSSPNSAAVPNIWFNMSWLGQKPGRGDNSDGLGTNLFWVNTGSNENLVNVAPRQQAWLDWAAGANGGDMGGFLLLESGGKIQLESLAGAILLESGEPATSGGGGQIITAEQLASMIAYRNQTISAFRRRQRERKNLAGRQR